MKTLTLWFLLFVFALLVLNKILERNDNVETFVSKDIIDKNIDKNIDADAMTSAGAITGESLCTLYSSQPMELNNKCNMLTKQNCNSTSCCGWLNGSSCVAGGANGPTFRTTKGQAIEVKSYSYMGKE